MPSSELEGQYESGFLLTITEPLGDHPLTQYCPSSAQSSNCSHCAEPRSVNRYLAPSPFVIGLLNTSTDSSCGCTGSRPPLRIIPSVTIVSSVDVREVVDMSAAVTQKSRIKKSPSLMYEAKVSRNVSHGGDQSDTSDNMA